MRRVNYTVHGGPAVLFVEDAPTPVPGPGQLLVRCEAVGVTLPMVRRVREAPEPVPLGGEIAGVVQALGPGVRGFGIGDRVTGLCFEHAYADLALLSEDMASRIPDHADATTAVALVRSGLVARQACALGLLGHGETVLITAAAGAVGTMAVQLARAHGARVIAAVSTAADKRAYLTALGAETVVDYDADSWGEPVDVALEGVGGQLLGKSVRALARSGRLVAFGAQPGSIPAGELMSRTASATGFRMATTSKPALLACWRDELWDWHRDGWLRTRVHAEIPLAEAHRAHEAIESRTNLGKVVLVVD
ncbi:NADP-dependent oxidoreductase [Saccharopolyspora rhizosphaerae]|uniref:NADP-dependent oxidoreductase n=1 Tax=Saccharopolyspora rhizosphaerae TaxID=2492662 RepID=A0A3R8R840_9PSEU|nr:NADP-dependent oxidoreductase [Saccharopolyspora rhizosphaerae]RRO20560.1 NADP-dependent oxidoreductase [Saccharopolyspora rhizosphaerae]